jgi:hypothetical protein
LWVLRLVAWVLHIDPTARRELEVTVAARKELAGPLPGLILAFAVLVTVFLVSELRN